MEAMTDAVFLAPRFCARFFSFSPFLGAASCSDLFLPVPIHNCVTGGQLSNIICSRYSHCIVHMRLPETSAFLAGAVTEPYVKCASGYLSHIRPRSAFMKGGSSLYCRTFLRHEIGHKRFAVLMSRTILCIRKKPNRQPRRGRAKPAQSFLYRVL